MLESHHQFVMPASGQSSVVVKYPEAKGMGSMDGYEFSFEIVRSPAVVALVTAIATSLGTGLCTYFAATHGKEKEWQRAEKTRKEERLYQRRVRLYEALLPMILRMNMAKTAQDKLSEKFTDKNRQDYMELLFTFNSLLPMAQIYASQKVYDAMSQLSYLINIKPTFDIEEVALKSGEVQTAIRAEIQEMNAEILKSKS